MSNRVSLESIVTKISNGVDAEQIDQPSNGMLPISRIETIWDGVIDFERVKYAQVTKAEIDKYALQSGDILFSHINSPTHIGKTAIYRSERPLIHGINLLLIRVDQKKCYPEYLNYYFKSKNVRALFRARCKKAVNQASLNQPDILELEVPLPPLTEQKRIASLLARADRLRQLRRTAHELGDALLQSVFLEMFGDPYRNEKKWKKKNLGALSKWRSGGTPSRENPEYFQGDVPWLSSGELEQMYTYSSNEHISEDALKKSNAAKIEIGSLLLGMYDTAALKSTINQVVCACNQAIAYAKFDESKINTVFVYWAIQVGKEDYRRLQRGVRQKNLNLSMIQEISIPVPPLSLQEEFAGVVARVESLRGRMGESTRHVEGLFESLLAEAFDE